jgi:hypothetical protein
MEHKKELLFIPFSNSKHKNRKDVFKRQSTLIYWWKLERLKKSSDVSIDGFYLGRDTTRIQTFKEDLIAKLNAKHLFDFEYSPQEKDYLSIHLNSLVYLHLSYEGNIWVEDSHFNPLRSCYSLYTELNKGKVDLSLFE